MHAAAKTRIAPTRIAPDTYVIHDHHGEGSAPVIVALNSMVIRGREPIVVDTGVAANREQFLADVFSLVEPQDVRWVFISHDDIDHTGNANALMDRCPNATLVINWFMAERMGETLEVPPTRWRWVGDGESFDAGDRQLYAVRPPVYDSPTSRGLFDPMTGVYWGGDAFASPMLTPTAHAEDLDPGFWVEGMATFHQYLSPWAALLDDRRFQREVDRLAALPIRTIASCHGPAIGEGRVGQAIRSIRTFPSAVVAPPPGQEVLDEMLGAMLAGAAGA